MSAVDFFQTKKVNIKPLIPALRTVKDCTDKEIEKIEMWLAFCSIGVTILDTGTKMLKHLKVIHDRNAIFDLLSAFKGLRSQFSGNKVFDELERETDDFIYNFLTSDDEHKKRVIKFQESILK